MSSTTFNIGDTVYLPFWILLDHLDASCPDSFVKCRIISLYEQTLRGPSSVSTILLCDINLGKDDLIAKSIPCSYLIKPEDLQGWKSKIADWFLNYKE